MALQKFIPLREYNPYHDASGRFTGSGGAKTTVAYAGRNKTGIKGKELARRSAEAKSNRAAAGLEPHASPLMRQDAHGRAGGLETPSKGHSKAAGHYARARDALKRGDRATYTRERNHALASGNLARFDQGKSDRIQHNQNPDKYTRPMSDGRAPKDMAAAKLHRNLSAGVGVSPMMAGDRDRRTEIESRARSIRTDAQRGLYSRRSEMLRDSATLKRDRKGGTRGGAPATGERERVPQNPKKYTQPKTDGTPRRPVGDLKKYRKIEDNIGVGTKFDSRLVDQDYTAKSRAGGFNIRGAKSSKAARAGALFAHDQAARGYHHAADLRRGANPNSQAVRGGADGNRAAAKAAERRAKRLAKAGR